MPRISLAPSGRFGTAYFGGAPNFIEVTDDGEIRPVSGPRDADRIRTWVSSSQVAFLKAGVFERFDLKTGDSATLSLGKETTEAATVFAARGVFILVKRTEQAGTRALIIDGKTARIVEADYLMEGVDPQKERFDFQLLDRGDVVRIRRRVDQAGGAAAEVDLWSGGRWTRNVISQARAPKQVYAIRRGAAVQITFVDELNGAIAAYAADIPIAAPRNVFIRRLSAGPADRELLELQTVGWGGAPFLETAISDGESGALYRHTPHGSLARKLLRERSRQQGRSFYKLVAANRDFAIVLEMSAHRDFAAYLLIDAKKRKAALMSVCRFEDRKISVSMTKHRAIGSGADFDAIHLNRIDRGGNRPARRAYYLHGGPHEEIQPIGNILTGILLREGYDVTAVNYVGSSGRGAAFREAIYGRVAETAEEIAALIAAGDAETKIVVGDSFGAYLGALVADLARPDAAILVGGFFDVSRFLAPNAPPEPALAACLSSEGRGLAVLHNKAAYAPIWEPGTERSLSPIATWRPSGAKYLLIHGCEDKVVEPQQSARYAAHLEGRGDAVQDFYLENEAHDLTLEGWKSLARTLAENLAENNEP